MDFYARQMPKVRDYLTINLLGGPKPLQFRYVINFQKFTTLFALYAFMQYFQNFSTNAYLITALHGTYGLCWILKECILPDPRYKNVYITIPSSLLNLTILVLYWPPGFIIISQDIDISPMRMAIAIMVHTFGIVFMLGADTQKFFVLKERQGLINDGWLARCRNTNYLGEIMIYATYAILAQHWLPWTIFISLWSTLFLANMAEKDVSLRNKPGGEAYMEQAGFLIPNVLGWIRDTLFGGGSVDHGKRKSYESIDDTLDEAM